MDGASGHKLYVGGGFAGSSSVSSPGIICWDGVSWRSVGGGLGPLSYAHSFVTKLAVYDDGHGPALYVAGDFGSAGGQPISYLAKWDGTSWSALGTGINGAVAGMVVWNDGSGSKLYVSGV